MQSTKPHFALLATPGMGHLIPFLELANRLVTHLTAKVTVFVVSGDHASISNSKLLKSPHPDLLDVVLLPPVDISNLPSDASVTLKVVVMMLESLPFVRSEIANMEFRPTALVVDMFGTDALGIADEFNMLKFTFIASNAWFFSVILYSSFIDRKEITEEHMKNHKPLKIPGCKSVEFQDTLEVFEMDPNDPLFEPYFELGVRMASTDGILVNSWDELEPITLKALKEDKKVPIYPIGPIVRPIDQQPGLGHDRVLNWLDKQPNGSVIYVSFGSGGTLSAQHVIELAWGLDHSQQRFVWVVRPPTENDASGSFFTAGNGSDGTPDYVPDGFFTRTQDRGLVVPMWAPQVEVLSHPSIGGFLTHGGWNSVMESIVNGVPMIAWPLYAEQKMNAAMLTEEIGASIRAKAAEVVGREEIESMVRRILVDKEGEPIRNRVKELKNSATKALSKGGCSSNSLSQVGEICIQHLKTKAYGA
ncbi:UDP-glucuronosyl/UDP-glucosyltransferase [Corchorus olitorius]|uniref:Glycosyltransferase n=1 Tax=Corchorus olitorius TaxID=93759 RepID=A0A1R3INX5_9ROSI|nr:UDP-glucuronosyl/UDP-glucosyltransferase [Corchorus olitorius]